MQKAHLGILIGRFQPFHLGHAFLIEEALKHCDALLIAIGSSFRARNFKNPWSFDERKALIQQHFPNAPLHFAAIPDFFYSENAWINAVKDSVKTHNPSKVTLFGHNKDYSSYYLKEFPSWHYHELPNLKSINATKIREEYFWNGDLDEAIPPSTRKFMATFQKTTEFARLQEEALFVRSYKNSWSHSPYPPLFVTTDALVTCDEHLLLIRRKLCPGKGLYALPGGFLEVNEWVETGLIRELVEETAIDVSNEILQKHLKAIRIFDYPDRSLIGRVITHSGHFDLPKPCPHIKAADDALSAEWIPLKSLFSLREQFHDDHYQIISTLLRSWL